MPDYPGERHLKFWQERLDDPCFVYVIQGRPGTAIKIGRAKSPLLRMATLQTGNPDCLRLLYVLPGGASLERRLHKRVGAFPASGGDEWFEFGPSVEQFLPFISALAEHMVEAYDGNGVAPLCPAFDEWGRDIEPERVPLAASKAAVRETTHKLGHRWRTSRAPAPVKISFTEPREVGPNVTPGDFL